MTRSLSALAALALAWAALALPARAELRLVMFEQAGCPYCNLWENEIGPIYPKTPEGQAAPLRKVNLRGPVPEDLELRGKPQFTPTFILVRDGVELKRIEGYPGEAFFWGLLGNMLQEQPEWNEMQGAAADG